jgi:hypothetical protein
VDTTPAYELYTAAFELLRQPWPCERRLRDACARASANAALTSAFELAAFDVVHRLPRRSMRHFAAVEPSCLA